VANPIREVQPEINLLANPIKEKLFLTVPDSARWEWRIDKMTATAACHRGKYRLVKPISPADLGSQPSVAGWR